MAMTGPQGQQTGVIGVSQSDKPSTDGPLTAGRTISIGPVASHANTADKHGHSVVVLCIVALVTVGDTSAVGGLLEATDWGHPSGGTCQPAQKCKHNNGPHGAF